MMLGIYQEVQQKVFNELHEIFNGDDRPMTLKDIQKMTYLERVIKETVRLMPVVPYVGKFVSENINLGKFVPNDNHIICIK